MNPTQRRAASLIYDNNAAEDFGGGVGLAVFQLSGEDPENPNGYGYLYWTHPIMNTTSICMILEDPFGEGATLDYQSAICNRPIEFGIESEISAGNCNGRPWVDLTLESGD